MNRILIILLMCLSTSIMAQSQNINYEEAKMAPIMEWMCPEMNKFMSLLDSLQNEDYQEYAKNIKDIIELYPNPSSPEEKFVVTQAQFTVEHPLFIPTNLFDFISTWIKTNEKDWAKELKFDKDNNTLTSSATINIASHSRFMHLNKVDITPSLIIQLSEGNKLLITFLNLTYTNKEYIGDNKKPITVHEKVAEVYPFKSSSYKTTYAKAYVNTYLYFWKFISALHKDLNSKFTKDTELLSQLHYEFSRDSLTALYGEPTKVIEDKSVQDINKEIRFYENTNKVIIMGKTIDFKDIISCQLVDDPTFIPGRSTTLGTGISIFGIGIGGAETYTTPNKTIHNYMVDIKIDNLSYPFIRIVTGQNENKATEITTAFEYVIRHQQRKGNK